MQPFLDVIWLEKCYVTIAIGIAHSIQFNSLSFFLSLTSKGLSPQLMDSMDQSVEGSIALIWNVPGGGIRGGVVRGGYLHPNSVFFFHFRIEDT